MKNDIQLVVIDDDGITLDIIATFLEGMEGFTIALQTTDPEQGLEYIRKYNPDLLITDVKMPGINGLTLSREMKKIRIPVILMSGFIEYALDGFDLQVMDYLHKPIRFKRFKKALKKVKKHLQSVEEKEEDLYLFGRSKPYGPYEPLLKSKINYIKGAAEYVELITEDKSFLIKASFNNLLQKLNAAEFMRIHKSYIIRLDFIKTVASDKLTLKDGTELPVGKSFKANVQAWIQKGTLD